MTPKMVRNTIHLYWSIGILICKTKDEEVVKYAMNRSMSPTMVAKYETKLINKSLLQKKLHELGDLTFEKFLMKS